MDLEERKKELIKKADNAQNAGDYEKMKYYDAEIKKINEILYGGIRKMEKIEKRLWIVPINDLEAKSIIKMLERNGENYLITGQTWGASWEGLEPETKIKIENAKKIGKKVYGVELQGNEEGVINIDHHTYGEDDRSNEKASIEQVAEILGVELTLDEKFIAANDKGFIPEMEKLGEELGISKEDLQEIISNIRMRDRFYQGISIEQEAEAEEAIKALGEIDGKQEYILVDNLPHSKTSTITDRLYGKYENLLITSTDGETNFYGTTEIIKVLNEKFPGGWSGGQLDKGNGFWGGYADQEAIKQAVQEAIDREKQKRLSGKVNVKSSKAKHSLNPFQGYLYDFVDTNNWLLNLPLDGEEYGEFIPINVYKNRYNAKFEYSKITKDVRNMDYENDDYGPTEENFDDIYYDDQEVFSNYKMSRIELAERAFRIYYTTRLLQKILKGKEDSIYYDFVDFDITSVTTEQEIELLDLQLEEMVNSSEIEEELKNLEGNAEFEKELYDELRKEVDDEIKKESDRTL